MQPLALQNASIPADAGDGAANAAAPAKSAGGILFGELLAAAAVPAASGDAQGAQQATDAANAETNPADEAVAALAAATQAASRGVTLKAAPAPVAINLSVTSTPLAEVTSDGATLDLTEGHPQAKSDDGADDDAATLAVTTDPSNMNVQALIHMAVNASISASDTSENMTQANNLQADIGPQTDQANAAQMDAIAVAHVAQSVNSSTSEIDADAVMSPGAADDLAEATVGAARPRIAALQAVAWFDAKAGKPAGRVEAGESAEIVAQTSQMLQAAAASQNPQSELSEDNHSDKDLSSDAPVQIEGADVDPAAAAMVAQSSVNTPTRVADEQRPLNVDHVLQGSSAPGPQWSEPVAVRNVNADGQARAAQASPSTHEISPTDKPAQATTGVQGASQDIAGVETQIAKSAAATTNASITNEADIRDLTKLTPTTSPSPETNAPVAPAPQIDVALEAMTDKANQRTIDPTKTAPVAKVVDEDEDAAKPTDAPTTHDGVHIRELLKLGVTDIALSHEAPPLAAPQTAAETTTGTPVPDVSNTIASTPQASNVATTNVETNGERRSIAEDIRLRALERMVVNAARNGTQILSIQLYPPGLGQVVLRLAMDGQRLRLATRTSTVEAAETLRNMETDLRSALAGNGLQLTGFDVSEDGTNDEAPRRERTAEPVVKTRSGGTGESFTVDLNA